MKRTIQIILLALLAGGCSIKRDFVRMKEQIAALETDQKRLEQRVAHQDSLNREQQETIKGLQAQAESPARGYRNLPAPPAITAPDGPGAKVDELPIGLANPDQPKEDLKQVYNAAYLDITRGSYEQAIAGFRAFLRNFPQSSLADNAQYWIGEGFYAQKLYAEALAEFRKVIDKYPNQDKVPAALYKAGLCYSELKDQKRAQEMWDKLLKKYPKSPEANMAKQRGPGN
jgi:tol-pal system protein YbgF